VRVMEEHSAVEQPESQVAGDGAIIHPSDFPGPLPARMLSEFAYCPRLCYLEWVQGEFGRGADILSGIGYFLAAGEIK